MTQELVIGLGQQSLYVALMAAAPMLALGLAVGLGVSVIQALTQIQDMSVSFIPKLVAAGAGLLWFSPWILQKLVTFTAQMLRRISEVAP